jgi:hypothetical protein
MSLSVKYSKLVLSLLDVPYQSYLPVSYLRSCCANICCTVPPELVGAFGNAGDPASLWKSLAYRPTAGAVR